MAATPPKPLGPVSSGAIPAWGCDAHLMDIALTLARWGLGTTAPNPSVGAVVFDPVAGEIVGRGVTKPGGRPHAEPVAIQAASGRARGATMAVTLEPCSHHGRSPPCVDAILDAGIARVIYAAVDPDPRVAGRGLDQLRAAGVEVIAAPPDRRARARWITRGHILRVTERRPLVQLKIAVGPEGRIAEGQGGRPTWVTGPIARQHGHMLRAMADAIVVGSGTMAADDPDLTCRLPGLVGRSPIRVVFGERPIPVGAKMLQNREIAPVWWITAVRPEEKQTRDDLDAVITAPRLGDGLWLPAVLERLVERGITRILVEGGPALWRSLSRARLVDEVVLFHARADKRRPTPEVAAVAALRHYCPELPLEGVDRRLAGEDDMFVFRTAEAGGWSAIPDGFGDEPSKAIG